MAESIVIFVLAVAVLLPFVVIGTKKSKPENYDWIDDMFRPCCRHRVYWTELAEGEAGYCEKTKSYVDWDYCCKKYDGIDTEVRDYGVDRDDV